MGWNEGGRIFEEQAIAMYDAGLLTPVSLDLIALPFKSTDCDTGGFRGLKAKDGLAMEMVVCKVMDPDGYENAVGNPEYCESWLDYLESEGKSPEDMPAEDRWSNNDKAYALFDSIWNGKWGIY